MISRPSRGALWLIAAVALLLTLNWVAAIARFQPNVLFMDQWDFLLPLFEEKGAWDLFIQQHGPHRQGLSSIIEGWILQATAWDARYESLWVAAVLLASTLAALRLKWRLTGTIGRRDAWIPIMGLSLGQFETVLSTPNASVGIFPLLLILLVANVWLARDPALRYLVAGALGFALTFAGFGLFAALVVAVLLAAAVIRHGLRRETEAAWFAVGGLAIAGSGWIVFLNGYVFVPAVEGFRFPWTPWTDYLRFFMLLFLLPSGEAGERWPHYLLGTSLMVFVVVVAAAIARAWTKRSASPQDEVLMLLMGSGLSFVVATAIGRIPLGVLAAATPRYLTLMFPVWLALYLGAAEFRRRLVRAAAGVCVWGLALGPYVWMLDRPLVEWPGTIGMTDSHLWAMTHYGTSKAGWAHTYLATGSVDAAQAAVPATMHPNPVGSNFDAKLRFLRERRLSFFSSPAGRCDYLPWLADDTFLNRALGSNRRACR